jgi:hypothetical protein
MDIITLALALKKSKIYTDDLLDEKLDLSGGTLSGNLDLGGNNVSGIQDIYGEGIHLDILTANDDGIIGVDSDMEMRGGKILTGLPAPNNAADATNKQYVDAVDALKANIFVRQAQGITTGNNIQGMHVRVPTAPAYTTDWSFVTADGQSFTRTDNNFVYRDSGGNETKLLENGVVLIADWTIANPFYISAITGDYSNPEFFYRYFDIKDLDQRIGLVSALETDDKSSIVNAINSLHDYVDALVESAEVSDSPFESYADFLAGSGGGIAQGKYAYVTFTDTDTWPSGGKWDSIAVGDTWRLDCGVSAWSPTSNMTASATATIADQSGTNALKAAGNDTVTEWLQSFRNNLKRLLGMLKTDGDGTKALLDDGTYGAAGKVNKVNGIAPDESITDPTDPGFRNVKTDYVFATEAEFNAADPTIPDGATVDKLWEYPDNYAGFIVVPDESQRTGNLIPVSGAASWTADKMGFVYARILAAGAGDVYVTRNGNKILNPWGNQSNWVDTASGVFAVTKGDIIAFSGGGSTAAGFNNVLQFMPPKLIAKDLPVVVEKNGSYSLDEVKTAETWIDGKPIYKRTFSFTTPAALGSNATYTTGVLNVKIVVKSEFIVEPPSANKLCFANVYFKSDGTLQISSSAFVSYTNSREIRFVANLPSGSSADLVNVPIHCTVYYTKTTD